MNKVEKIKSEIERLKECCDYNEENAYDNILAFIDTLEVKEVDLEKEQGEKQYIEPEPCEPWSDEQTKRNLISYLKSLGATECPTSCCNRYIEYLEKQDKQNIGYSKDDARIIDGLISICDEAQDDVPRLSVRFCHVEALKKWLESFKNRCVPQLKQEWNGEDDAHLHSLITHLEQWIESNPGTTGADIQGENVAWLKSLKLKLKD